MAFRNVFITGASSGLGRGLALHYANAGATVFAVARRTAQLNELAAAVRPGSGRVVPLTLDAGDLEALVSAIHGAEQQSGGALDLVIANAGTGYPTDGRQLDWRAVESLLHLNVNAAAATVSAALPAMVARNAGTVAVVASLAALRGLPGNGAYCASKAAMQTYMESLRVDLRATKVKALTIYPGFVKTELTARNRYPMPFLMELDDAVRVMVRGLARGQRKIFFPFPLAAGMRWLAGLPDVLYEWLAARLAPKQGGGKA